MREEGRSTGDARGQAGVVHGGDPLPGWGGERAESASDLREDYGAAGFTGRLGFGTRPAVVLVDVVRAYTEELLAASPARRGGRLLAMDELAEVARESRVPVVFTAVSYPHGEADAPLFFRKVPALRVFVEGSPLARFPERPAPRPHEPVVVKHYASAFFGTALATWLTACQVDTLLVAGFSTSGCVRATALDALQHGFRPAVVRECVADRDPGPHEANLFDLDAKYADVVTLAEALAYLRAPG